MITLERFFDGAKDYNEDPDTQDEIFINTQRESFKSFNEVILQRKNKNSSYSVILPLEAAESFSVVHHYLIKIGNVLSNILKYFLEKNNEGIVVIREYEYNKRKIDLYIEYNDEKYWVEVKANDNHDSGKNENIDFRIKEKPNDICKYFVVHFWNELSLSDFCQKFNLDFTKVREMAKSIFDEKRREQLFENVIKYCCKNPDLEKNIAECLNGKEE